MSLRLKANWVTTLPEDHPYPLTHPFTIRIGKPEGTLAASPASTSAPAPAGSQQLPTCGLSEEQQMSGRWWSAKVLLISGIHQTALHHPEARHFQV